MALKYSCTNENLFAITAGLAPKLEDKVVAICGAGCQALALLDYAGEVVAVDNNPGQVEFARKRIELLEKGLFEEFLNPNERGELDGFVDGVRLDSTLEAHKQNLSMRKSFFTYERLERIRKKISRLSIVNSEIIAFLKNNSVQGIYMSNAIGPLELISSNNVWAVEVINQALKSNGSIYFSNARRAEAAEYADCWPVELQLDVIKTNAANMHEKRWRPAIYSKSN